MVPAEEVEAILPELHAVSDDWLEHEAASEKGFSLGFFDGDYLRRFPVALLEAAGAHSGLRQRVARARARGALGRSDAVPAHRAEGRHGRACSVASCCGASERATAGSRSAWLRCRGCRAGRSLPRGRASDLWSSATTRRSTNFQGVRAYKDKFHPVWEPRYLAYDGVLELPQVLGDVTALHDHRASASA